MKDYLIEDFTNEHFASAFKLYFAELEIQVSKWDELFQEMNHDPNGKNYAYVRLSDDGNVVGFIQFSTLDVRSWFFETKAGFIREFWVAEPYRNHGHGSALLSLAEDFFQEQELPVSILTTDTAPKFYLTHGYTQTNAITAKNEQDVFVKLLQPKASQ